MLWIAVKYIVVVLLHPGPPWAQEELLTLLAEVGSLLRAALGPKTRDTPGQPRADTMIRQFALSDLLDHPVKESRWRVSISCETRPVYV